MNVKLETTMIVLNHSGKGLEFLDSLYRSLLNMKDNSSIVYTLNITQNRLKRLFEELVPEQSLFKVEALDICENPIEDICYTIQEIQHTMPNLKDLRLNLYDEDHVDFIMKAMP